MILDFIALQYPSSYYRYKTAKNYRIMMESYSAGNIFLKDTIFRRSFISFDITLICRGRASTSSKLEVLKNSLNNSWNKN